MQSCTAGSLCMHPPHMVPADPDRTGRACGCLGGGAGCSRLGAVPPCRLPCAKAVLLYGAPRTGKTLVCQAVAHLAGANFFNLSPRNTDGKYPGKAVAMMTHMVCCLSASRGLGTVPLLLPAGVVRCVFMSGRPGARGLGEKVCPVAASCPRAALTHVQRQ